MFLLVLIVLGSSTLFLMAQTAGTGALSGTVKDLQGGSVSGATVTVAGP